MKQTHRIVSSESEELILVDEQDNEIGHLSKADCHDGKGVLHRAFSLFLFNEAGELLLQRRSGEKRLWPGFWANSCCSHPRRDESMLEATSRRMQDELNICAEVEFVYSFCYEAKFQNLGSENELCHVFLGKVDGQVRPNESEIESVRYLSVEALSSELECAPERFTPWLQLEWRALRSEYAEDLARYAK